MTSVVSGVSLRWAAVVMVAAAVLLILATLFCLERTIQEIGSNHELVAETRDSGSFIAASDMLAEHFGRVAHDAARAGYCLVQTTNGNLTASSVASQSGSIFSTLWALSREQGAASVLLSVSAASVYTAGPPVVHAATVFDVSGAQWLQSSAAMTPQPIGNGTFTLTLDLFNIQLLGTSNLAARQRNGTASRPSSELLLPEQVPLVLKRLEKSTAAWSFPPRSTSQAVVYFGIGGPPTATVHVAATMSLGAVLREIILATQQMNFEGGRHLLILNLTTFGLLAAADISGSANSSPCDPSYRNGVECANYLASVDSTFLPLWWKNAVLQPTVGAGGIPVAPSGAPATLSQCPMATKRCLTLLLPLPRSSEVLLLLWISSPTSSISVSSHLLARVVIASLLLFASVVASGFWAAGWLSIFRPMDPLTERMTDVQALNFECLEVAEEEVQRQTTAEMRDLHDSFYHMVGNIRAFSQYVSKPVLLDLMQCGKVDAREMESRDLTLIMIDIAGFTTMCESLSTEQLVELAETYFDAASRTVMLHGCTLDKYVGDAIVGFWGAPLPYDRQAYSSCAAALHVQTVVRRLQPLFRDNGVELSVRIGLHSGAALVGNIGCSQRVSYTAIGSNVTIAAHLEEENKRQKTGILVSEAVAAAAESDSPDLFVFRCVGRISELVAYELVGVSRSAIADVVRLSKDNAVSEISTATKTQSQGTSFPKSTALTDGSERDRARRRQSVSTDNNGSASLTASQRRTEQPMSNEAAPSSGTGNTYLMLRRRTRPVRLNEYDEVLLIQQSFHISREHVEVIQALSNAVYGAAVSGELFEALPTLNKILEEEKEVLNEHSINISVLQRLAQQWSRQMQSEVMHPPATPARSPAFGGSPYQAALSA